MKTRSLPLIILWIIIFSLNGYAQTYLPDSSVRPPISGIPFLTRNLDSLLRLPQVKAWAQGNESKMGASSGDIIDTDIKKRLESLPNTICLDYSDMMFQYLHFLIKEKKTNCEVMLGIQKLYEKNLVERLKFYELPEQLKYLPMALSANYLPAKSVSGAAGIWQLPYTTAKLHNLRIDSYVDDRYDIPKATETALTHLKLLYSIYHDWHLTLTAYTCGSASVNKAIRRAGGKTEYTNIYPFLPEGLRDIIPVFTVVSYLAQEYDKHNLHPADITSRFRVDSVTVTRPLQLMQASRLLNIPAEEIKSLNPVYKINVIPAWNASYKMALPPGNVANFQKLADSIYRLSDSIYFSKPVLIADNSNSPTVKKVKEKKNSRSKTETKSEAKSEKQTTKNATTEDSSEFYTVKKGESLGGVASKLKITVADIKKCNKIRKNTIFPGQKLKICR